MFLQRGIKKNIYREIVIIVFFQSFQRRVKFNSKKEREREIATKTHEIGERAWNERRGVSALVHVNP